MIYLSTENRPIGRRDPHHPVRHSISGGSAHYDRCAVSECRPAGEMTRELWITHRQVRQVGGNARLDTVCDGYSQTNLLLTTRLIGVVEGGDTINDR